MDTLPLCLRPANFSPPAPVPSAAPPAPPAPSSSVFKLFHAEHCSFVRVVLLRRGVPDRDVEDLVQEVFLIAFRRWDSLVAEQARPWLFVVAGFVASNYRNLARHRRESFSDEAPEGVIPGFDPESIDAVRTLGRVLGRLRPKVREVFVRYALRGQSIQEIAQALGIKLKTAYARLDAARDCLARIAH